MKAKGVREFEAEGEIERVFHEIRQCLRVTGVNLNFRTWAAFDKFLPAMWNGMRPNVETVSFQRAADRIRNEAAKQATALSLQMESAASDYGESRGYQIRAALDLYHYINPKLLVITSAVHLALQGERIGAAQGGGVQTLPNGEPERMFAMEMEAETPEDEDLRELFRDIKKTLGLSQINSDYRTLALWPDYLASAWRKLKPVCQTAEYNRAGDELREISRQLARSLPHAYALDLRRVRELGENRDQVLETTRQFEKLLPSLILNIALLHREWQSPDRKASPSEPAPTFARKRGELDWRAFQKRQKVAELHNRFVSYIDEGEGETVVLLHGIPTWSFLWANTIDLLKRDYRVIAPDLLGFGYSDKRDCFDRSIARQTDAIDSLLEKLDIHRANIIAHDIGGGVALRLATLHAPRVRSLCLLNSICYDSWPIEVMLQLGHPAAFRKMSASTACKMLKQALKMGFHSKPDSKWLDALLSPWRTEVGKLSLIRNVSALNTNLTTEVTHLLPKISAPVLILWGEDDRFQLVKFGDRLARDIPGARLERLADARHFAMIDQPAAVHSHIRRFLADALSPDTTPTPLTSARKSSRGTAPHSKRVRTMRGETKIEARSRGFSNDDSSRTG